MKYWVGHLSDGTNGGKGSYILFEITGNPVKSKNVMLYHYTRHEIISCARPVVRNLYPEEKALIPDIIARYTSSNRPHFARSIEPHSYWGSYSDHDTSDWSYHDYYDGEPPDTEMDWGYAEDLPWRDRY